NGRMTYAPRAASKCEGIPRACRSGISIAGRVTCSATMGTSFDNAAPSTTGTSLYSHGCRSMTWPSGNSCVTAVSKMPKCVRESSAVSGPAWPATHSTLPTRSSQSWASCENKRIGPYLRYEKDPYVEQVPQKPFHSLNVSAAMFTVARPTISPALPNSVICVGSTVPARFESRSYQPSPGMSPESLAKPARLVDSARSADAPRNSGRPCSFFENALTYEPHTP